jgi:ribosomal protein L9
MQQAQKWEPLPPIPFFGARRVARDLSSQVTQLRAHLDAANQHMQRLGLFTVLELEGKRVQLERDIDEQREMLQKERSRAIAAIDEVRQQEAEIRRRVVETEDLALLQEAGVYEYHHPLTDAVAYREQLDRIGDQVKEMTRRDGGAIHATTSWTVNGSAAQGRAMVRDFSKLMLRAFNAEADNLVRGLKPYKVRAAIERLQKVAEMIERLGRTMDIRVSRDYLQLRTKELELTADFLEKQAEEKEAERAEKERLREERKVQQEIERERQKLEKERQHFENALSALLAKGDDAAAERIRDQLADVEKAIADVDYRAANIRAGYVYVVSNVGSFGERMIKVGMTRRLDPLDRIRELSDASVPFNFDVHALFFSKDAVGIEGAMHARLSKERVNLVNRRREFFRVTPGDAKAHLSELAGELLEFQDLPEALEYRQSLAVLSEGQHSPIGASQDAGVS